MTSFPKKAHPARKHIILLYLAKKLLLLEKASPALPRNEAHPAWTWHILDGQVAGDNYFAGDDQDARGRQLAQQLLLLE